MKRRARQPAARNPKVPSSSSPLDVPPRVRLSDPRKAKINSKRLAAYCLGHHAYTLRLWQKVFWETPEAENAENGVSLVIEQLSDALVALADELASGLTRELRQVLHSIERCHRRMVDSWRTTRSYAGAAFGSVPVPGEGDWNQLCSLAERALSKDPMLAGWVQLGIAVGWCQVALVFADPRCEPSVEEIVQKAKAMSGTEIRLVPELSALVKLGPQLKKLGEVTFMHKVLERAGNPDKWGKQEAALDSYLLSRAMAALDRSIQDQLAQQTASPRVRTQRPTAAKPPKPTWSARRCELSVNGTVVKQVRRIAKNVIAVLNKFEQQRWTTPIVDPLPNGPNPQRLHDTIKSLNQDMGKDPASRKTLRFHADGSGTGIVWEWA